MGIRSIFRDKAKLMRIAGLVVLVLVAAGLYVNFGPPGLYAKSGTPEFCAQCHVMEAEYENWFHNGGHRRLKCIDCHLPNDNMAQAPYLEGLRGDVGCLCLLFRSGSGDHPALRVGCGHLAGKLSALP